MTDLRRETRLLCSELVTVSWPDFSGRKQEAVAVLEDISPSGACFQIDGPIPTGESVTVHYSSGDLPGSVRYCRSTDIGFYVGVQFAPSVRWLQSDFRPDHLLDPRQLH